MATAPKILFIDIETFPLVTSAWGVYEANALEILEYQPICCFSAKWQNGPHITKALPDYPGYKPFSRDDEAMTAELWDLMNEADIVVAHNGDQYDIPLMKARFARWGFGPTSPVMSIDTRKIAKRVFRFASNKLDYIGDFFGIGRKVQTGGYSLWQDCMAGKEAAWKKMKVYNKADVTLLEKIYDKFLPWVPNHPNRALFDGPEACPRCGSTNSLQKRGEARTVSRVYQRYFCKSCGGWSRGTKAHGPKVLAI
jgi:DNA polymerase elongation subunit (family B)